MLVGRDSALEILGGMRSALAEGVGGAVLVAGEQGIGKTELLRASLADGSGYRLLWGTADELGQSLPLTLMRQCLASADAGSSSGVPDEDFTAGVYGGDPVLAAVEEMLAAVDRLCAATPVALVAEDLQWADEASLLAWYRLSRAVSQLPLLVVGSCRSGSGQHDMAGLRRSLTARHGTVLELGPLAKPELGLLVENLVGAQPGKRLSGHLDRAGGNPLYARELVNGLLRDGRIQVKQGIAELSVTGEEGLARVPASVSAAVAERLAHVADDIIEVLRWAAVLGTEFSVTDLAVVVGRPAGDLIDVIGRAQAAGLVVGGDHGLAFRHDVIREVLYEQVTAKFRASLHVQAAAALATAGAAPERIAAQLASSIALGEGQEEAQPWVLEWLMRHSPVLVYRAPRVAADLLRSVLARLAPHDPRRGQLEASLLTPLSMTGQFAEVERVGRRLLATAGDPDLSWVVVHSMIRAGRAAEAGEIVREAQGAGQLTPAQNARLNALSGNILALLGRVDQATEKANAALTDRSGDPLAQGLAHYVLSSLSYVHRDSHARLKHLDQAISALGNAPQLSYLKQIVLTNRTNVLDDLDRRDEALAAGREAVVLGERIGGSRTGLASTMVAIAYYTSGQWSDALAEIEPIHGGESADYLGMYANALAALIAARRGDEDEAARHLSTVPDTPGWIKQAGPQALHGPMLARAVTAEQRGGPRDAITVLSQCLDPDLGKMMPMRHVLLPDLTRLALEVNDAWLAHAAADAAAQEARQEPLAWKRSVADHCRGLVEQDAQAVLAAAEYYRGAGRVIEYGAAIENAAVLVAHADGPAAARKLAAEALRQYARLGAQWDIRRAGERLRAHGVRQIARARGNRPDTGWAALTPTEIQVAQLVAQGLSNPDIAARLFLSRNTVQTHVSHILGKLGASSRVEIMRLTAEYLALPCQQAPRRNLTELTDGAGIPAGRGWHRVGAQR
jgi:DNA-binding CsgD family transcriptional regulator